jgi:hypothetical protein
MAELPKLKDGQKLICPFHYVKAKALYVEDHPTQ